MSRFKAPTHPKPPHAKQKPHTKTYHGVTVSDPYAWLKDPAYPKVEDPEILSYLEEENAYYQEVMKPHDPLKQKLFEEIKGRITEDDQAVPWIDGAYSYTWSFHKGAQYRTWSRTHLESNQTEILLDETLEAKNKDYYKVGSLDVSPNDTFMAWTVDENGSERYSLFIKNIHTNKMFSETIENVHGNVIWVAESKAFVYVIASNEWRPYQVKLHRLGTNPKDDIVLYEEKDHSFFVNISLASSRNYFFIRTADHVTAEVYAASTHDPLKPLTLMAKRKTGRDLYVDHGQDLFFIRINDTHKNYRIVTTKTASATQDHWQEFKAGSDDHYYCGLQIFQSFVAIEDKIKGLDQILIVHNNGKEHMVQWPETVYATGLGTNPMYNQTHLRLTYESMITPLSVFDYNPTTQELTLKKEQQIPSGYDKTKYETKRLHINARDGAHIPVSLVTKKGGFEQAAGPMHLYGYGAYALGMDPGFSAARISLLDRGFIYAIAHVRGGDELGYGWYEAGKLYQRTNCFYDFIDVAEGLIEKGLASKGGISISGGSAGGELMGAAVNMAPDLFKAVVLHVPFVDVLNTMLDDTLPLTPIEWPEWGNPIESKKAFDYIQSYSPYDHIEAKDYPPMLVTGGLHDPRVTYWEPAKWTAKLRATKKDTNVLLMKINMGAGHGGKSGRYDRIEEVAEEYAFLLLAHAYKEAL